MRPRVVFVDHVARLSGGEIALLRVLPALAEHCDVHVILAEDGPLVARLQERGVAVEVLAMPARLRDVRRDATRLSRIDPRALAALPAYVMRLRRRLRSLDADLVQTNSLKAALYGGLAGHLARIPVIWHIRDRIADDYLPRATVLLVRGAARVVPIAIVANSAATAATLPSRRPLRVIADSAEPPPDRGRRQSGPFTVGVLGRITPWKGQHVFLEAFAAAFAGSDVRGHVIGSAMFGEESQLGELQRQAQALGIAEQIEFRGFREDTWAELAQLDILVHCSTVAEPFGQVVLEGMAAGVAVIAARAGGPAELITAGKDGLLTTPGDASALARALTQLHDDPKLRARLAAAARERAAAFTPQRAAAALGALYGELLARNGS
ncbi:MAG: glycosyltransferase [Solirubrobacteraceae bacterium]|jgi:glycosyltransferase involved in cell wall biosynthesis